jgi:hypothetical protein
MATSNNDLPSNNLRVTGPKASHCQYDDADTYLDLFLKF